MKGRTLLSAASLAALVLTGPAAPASAQPAFADMILWCDADGSLYIRNNTADKTINLDGYTISSPAGGLLYHDYDGKTGWRAFEDILTQFQGEIGNLVAALGAGALTFGSAPPGGAPTNLSELTLSPVGAQFEPGEQWFLGRPFAAPPTGPISFFYKTVDGPDPHLGTVLCVPEPPGCLLALLGLAALRPAQRARSARHGRPPAPK